MIFRYASPILSGFAVYLVALMIGARDMAFPRLNVFTYWTYLFSGTFLYISTVIGQAPPAGWFASVPFTIGAFIYGLAILRSIVNLIKSLQSGELAGKNPWNADGLEWKSDSPPKPYGPVHIPLVASRHRLWDDVEEDEDPENDRVLDPAG